ncbi:ABC transporter permease [Candidatus Woesearchaeota archaeon]|nr:ABC transporter permease [Candidatus Woesearchaeota archaeon]
MRLSKCFKHALNMVVHSQLRSWLTILGIVIGVASVIAIMSMGAGLEDDITSRLSNSGADIVTITAGYSRAFDFGPGRDWGGGGSVATEEEIVLDRSDLQALRGLADISLINPTISGNAEVYYLGKKGSVRVTGVDTSVWPQITTEEIAEGRMLGPADSNVIVIGGSIADGFFEKPVGLNQMLTIEDRAFRVVGILDTNSMEIVMPLMATYQVLDDKEMDVYDSFVVKIKNEDDLETAIANIEEKLMLTRHVTAKDKDFSVSNPKEQAEIRAEMMSSMTAFLTAIAAVALLVGAVGVANTMFTSVLEKTKEIGIMKALGAKNRDILTLFLLNSVLIGLIGGLIGIFFGYLLSGFLPGLMGQGGVAGRLASSSVVTLQSVILAISISVVIGTLSGAIPAYQASKLKPVDALRYE